MLTGEAKVAGIVDWDRKLGALRTLFGRTYKLICQNVYRPAVPPVGLVESFKSWYTSSPTKPEYVAFFDRLATCLGCPHVTGQALISCSYDQFLDYLPAAKRLLLRRERSAANYVPFNVDLRSHELGIELEWLERGVVDQRFMYVSRESVHDWNEVILAQEYVTYEHCEDALKKFLKSETWTRLIKDRLVGSIVILGAGAFSKDVLILKSILSSDQYDADNPVKMFHFDSSFYMLADTIRRLEAVLRRTEPAAVELIPCCADFMRLREWRAVLQPLDERQRTAFFILGNTIGNVNESQLVEAVKSVSRPGDIFVVSAEFAPADRAGFESWLLKRYDKVESRDLALNSIRNLLDEDKFSPHAEERRKLVDVMIERADHLPGELRSSVPETIAVVFKTNKPVGHSTGHPGELVLVTSKRYVEDEFRRVMEASHGFEFRGPSFSSSDDENYKHLVFQRRELEPGTEVPHD